MMTINKELHVLCLYSYLIDFWSYILSLPKSSNCTDNKEINAIYKKRLQRKLFITSEWKRNNTEVIHTTTERQTKLIIMLA